MVKSVRFLILLCSYLSCCTLPAQDSRPLGDIAREYRTQPRPHASTIYTNRDLARLSNNAAPMSATITWDHELPAQDIFQETQKLERAYQEDLIADFQQQQRLVHSLQQNLDESQHRYSTMATLYYVDVGYYLRNPELWKKQVSTLEESIARTKGEIDAATQRLNDLGERMRRAGIRVPD